MDAICILEWLKVLGPIIVAIAVFFVTWSFYRWQIRLAKQKLRHDLYDRRFAIYAAFRELLIALIEKNDEEIVAAFRKASIARIEAKFVLGDTKLEAILDDLCKQVTDDVISNIMYIDGMKPHLATSDPQTRQDFAERVGRLGKSKLTVFGRYFEELPKHFANFLKLTDFSK
jgi:HEAT repeat protein